MTAKANISLNTPTVYYVLTVHKELEKNLYKTCFYLLYRGKYIFLKRKWKMKVHNFKN